MKYKIHYTSKVRRDLDEIWDYIVSEHQNISSADKIIQSILDAVEQLESFPSLGPALDSIIDVKSDYRFLTTGKYLTFYRILEDEIRVERVLYGSRDYRPCLLDDFSD
ncbi:MAG: type II toxin-antitoxin system RelE/ParE family toxin [Lawsonibacter sp.]|jgi:toxin ParE1/3/4|nr:type II toxin-antitoxin system RelE/ParE family toxin [Lawsonibacter sp.]